MAAGYPILGTQVIQVDPDRLRSTFGHGDLEAFRKPAGKGFDDDIARYHGWKIGRPASHFHTLCFLFRQVCPDFRAEALEGLQFINP